MQNYTQQEEGKVSKGGVFMGTPVHTNKITDHTTYCCQGLKPSVAKENY